MKHIDVVRAHKSASKLGDGYSRFYKRIKNDSFDRHCWSIMGPEGGLVFQAGPLTSDPKKSKRMQELAGGMSFTELVDGIPWMGWDLGGHHFFKHDDYFQENEFCVLIDAVCYYDGGTAIGAEDLLKGYIASHLDDEWLYQQLEDKYEGWMRRG